MRWILVAILSLIAGGAEAALSSTLVWEIDAATGANANGGGYDPTSGTPGRDYTQGAYQATYSYTDIVIGADTATGTSVIRPFVANDVGNILNVTAGTGFTVQHVQIMSVAAGVATFDKSLGTTASTGGTGKLGGAKASFNCVGTDTILPLVAGNTVYIKVGSYTSGAAADYSANDGTALLPITVVGYSAAPDRTKYGTTNGTSRPLFTQGNIWTLGDYYEVRNLRWTGAIDSEVTAGTENCFVNCYGTNTGATTTYEACIAGQSCQFIACEFSAPQCIGVTIASTIVRFVGCNFHDCRQAISGTSGMAIVVTCQFDSCYRGITIASGTRTTIINCTFHNCFQGLNVTSGSGFCFINNIISQCYVGYTASSNTLNQFSDYNDWYGNTTDIATGSGPTINSRGHDIDADPGFTSGIATGTTATAIVASPYTFTATGLLAGVTTDDTLVVKAGTHATAGVYSIISIAGLPNTITLNRACCTENADHGDIVWGIVLGGTATDLRTGRNVRAMGFPSTFPGMTATRQSHVDVGANQQQAYRYLGIGLGP